MRSLFFLCFLLSFTLLAAQTPNLKIVTWNIRDLGGSKDEAEIAVMAKVLDDFDVIAIQEVVAGDPKGARAVARLCAALERQGSDYDYRVSNPTQSSSAYIRERYAFIWKTSDVKLVGRPYLLEAYREQIEREPYVATFRWEGKPFRVVNLHAVPRSKQPERELAQLRDLPELFADMPLFLLGDFNLVSRHSVFNPWLKRGYALAVHNQPTTLRRQFKSGAGAYAREADNILVPAHQVQLLEGGMLDVAAYFKYDVKAANRLSDHVPVYTIVDDFLQLDHLLQRGE